MKQESPGIHLVIMMLIMLAAPIALAKTQPNVIFMLTDDLGYSDIGCYGAKKVKTPHIDRLAEEGFTSKACPFTINHPALLTCRQSQNLFFPRKIVGPENLL